MTILDDLNIQESERTWEDWMVVLQHELQENQFPTFNKLELALLAFHQKLEARLVDMTHSRDCWKNMCCDADARCEQLQEAIRRIGDIDANTYNASTPELHAEILKALDLVRGATP